MCGITPFQGVSSWVSMNHWSHQTGSFSPSPPYSSPLSPSLFLSPSPRSPPPFPVTLQSPRGVCLWSARLISVGEEKTNWETVPAVNLTREGGGNLQWPHFHCSRVSPSSTPPPPVRWKPLTCINMYRHSQTLNKAVSTQVFTAHLT